jgi:hypothetical protein
MAGRNGAIDAGGSGKRRCGASTIAAVAGTWVATGVVRVSQGAGIVALKCANVRTLGLRIHANLEAMLRV